MTKHGAAVVTAAISPFAEARAKARERIGAFVEVYVRCSIAELPSARWSASSSA